ncbi:hypothetical protein Y032_0157g3209 [Ancylostoma ceylanicum]|nr:hypothetical protein Y032_0157g3209 [Ancylostoma ceylanicum]
MVVNGHEYQEIWSIDLPIFSQFRSVASYASFDAVSLYTNVDNGCATKAVLDLFEEHQADVNVIGLTKDELEQLLMTTLACSVFRFNNKYYMQQRGLAMGLRLAPLLAIVYLDRIERKSLTTSVVFYKRHIDDVFVVGSSPEVLQEVLNNLNSHDPNIKFTIEEPDPNGFLPFLNTKVCIQDGLNEFGWYKKPSSKNIIIQSGSAHPIYMKANVVRSIRRTKDKIGGVANSSNDNEMERILEENGYSKDVSRTWYPFSPPDGIPMVLPFVNDRTAREVNRIVRRSSLPIRLVFEPSPDLKDLLTSSRRAVSVAVTTYSAGIQTLAGSQGSSDIVTTV